MNNKQQNWKPCFYLEAERHEAEFFVGVFSEPRVSVLLVNNCGELDVYESVDDFQYSGINVNGLEGWGIDVAKQCVERMIARWDRLDEEDFDGE